MYRETKKRGTLDNLNLDSLMDILTCTVGLMLFIVIFAVIEAQGVRIKMFTPMVKDAPANSGRKLFICKNGRIRFFDSVNSIEKLLGNWKLSYKNVPAIVESANKKNITDGYFDYKLDYDQWTEGDWYQGQTNYRSIILIVNERGDKKGETADQLKFNTAEFREIIEKFNKNNVWIAFSVDTKSFEVFREARKICVENGFITGWDPADIIFPLRTVILGGGRRSGSGTYDPTPKFTKPQV